MNRQLVAEIAARLQAVGFKKRAGAQFTREVSRDVLGWLGLNSATKYQPVDEVEVNPVVGIRHQEIERIVTDLCGERMHPYRPPTVSTPIGYLMPAGRFRTWHFVGSGPAEAVDELAAAVSEYAVPFMESGSSLSRVCEYIDMRLGFDHQLAYRRPVAWLLAGDPERAFRDIDEAESALAWQSENAAATELRSFIAAFRERYRDVPPRDVTSSVEP